MAEKHWVNLKREPADPDKWTRITRRDVEPIPNERRVDCFTYELEFSDASGVKLANVSLKEGGGNIGYSDGEEGRNQNFGIQQMNTVGVKRDGAKTAQLCEGMASAAGKNTYTVEALDPTTGEVVHAPSEREVCRRLFYYSCIVQPVAQAPFIAPDGSVVSGRISEAAIASVLDKMESYHWSDSDFRILLCNKGNFTFKAPSGHAYCLDSERVVERLGSYDNTVLLERNHEAYEATRIQQQIGSIVNVGRFDGARARQQVIDMSQKTVTASADAWSWLDQIARVIPRGDADELIPNYFVIAWVNTLATRVEKTIYLTTDAMALESQAALQLVDDEAVSIEIETGAPLWYCLDMTDDINRSWFISLQIAFEHTSGPTDASGQPLTEILDVPATAVNPTGRPLGEYGGYDRVMIDLSHEELAGVRNRFLLARTSGRFLIKLKVRVVESAAAGYLMNGTNVIVVSNRGLFKRDSPAKKQYILHHELGHAMGMVAQGGRKDVCRMTRSPYLTPDAPRTLYGNIVGGPRDNSRKHYGPHCDAGMTWRAPLTVRGKTHGGWKGTPGCVMWGQTGHVDGESGYTDTPHAYCADCQPIVRKLDLSNLFPATLHGLKK